MCLVGPVLPRWRQAWGREIRTLQTDTAASLWWTAPAFGAFSPRTLFSAPALRNAPGRTSLVFPLLVFFSPSALNSFELQRLTPVLTHLPYTGLCFWIQGRCCIPLGHTIESRG